MSASMVTPRWFAWPVRSADGVVVDAVDLEGVVAQVAPQHREHAELVRPGEGLAHLLDLAGGLVGPEVDGGADPGRPHVVRLVDGAEHDLVELVGVGQQLVVVELDDEGDAVGVAPRHRAQHPEGGRHRVAPALDGQLDDVLRVEVARVRREGRRGGVLDALVDREDRHVAGATQAPVVVERLEAAQHLRRAVAVHQHALDVVGARQREVVGGDALRHVGEQRVGLFAEEGLDVHGCCSWCVVRARVGPCRMVGGQVRADRSP